jgi:hypothetical protein
MFTGAEKLLALFAKLLNQMSLALAQVTYTPAELAAICGCEAPLLAPTVIVEENVLPSAARRNRMDPESSHATLISPAGPTATAGIPA